MKKILKILTITTALIVYSCGQKQEFMRVAADIAVQEPSPTNQSPSEKVETSVDRKIIKEGEISFETGNISETKSLITRMFRS